MPSTPRRTQTERRETTQRTLIEHAMRAFAARGFEATTLAEIADAAGVSKGGVHHHFAAKRDLVVPVFRAATESVRTRIVAAASPERAPIARLRAGLECARAIVESDDTAAAAWVECVIAARRDAELAAAIHSERAAIEADIASAVRIEMETAGLPWSGWSDTAAAAALGWAIGRVLRK